MTRFVMMGPPGCGKGTHAAGLAETLGVLVVSTGELFRERAGEKSRAGSELARIMATGELVPDRVTNELIAERLGEPGTRGGFVLDGYPRSVPQVDELDRILAGHDAALDGVVFIRVEEEEILRRLTARAEQDGRSDDTPETIRHRIRVYERETAPVASVYEERGILLPVDGVGSVEEVAARIRSVVPDAAPSAP